MLFHLNHCTSLLQVRQELLCRLAFVISWYSCRTLGICFRNSVFVIFAFKVSCSFPYLLKICLLEREVWSQRGQCICVSQKVSSTIVYFKLELLFSVYPSCKLPFRFRQSKEGKSALDGWCKAWIYFHRGKYGNVESPSTQPVLSSQLLCSWSVFSRRRNSSIQEPSFLYSRVERYLSDTAQLLFRSVRSRYSVQMIVWNLVVLAQDH